MICGGGVWTPTGPTLVERAGGRELWIPTGNGQLDVGRGDFANSIMRVGLDLAFDPGCSAACDGFDPTAPSEACMASCANVFMPRLAPGDAAAGVRTYPVVHGERGAVRIIDGLLATSSVALIAGYATGVVPWRMVVMVLAPVLQLVVYKRALRRGITSRDCVNLTWLGTGLLVAYHLWIVAGLPGVGVVPPGGAA